MKNKIKSIINNSLETKKLLLNNDVLDSICKAADEIIASIKNKGKLITFGNGGSAADAQHMVCELVGRFKKERRPIPAISLTTNTSSLTAISNDYSYRDSFGRQLEALADKNDIAFGISTSGNASNVLEAIKKANALKVKTIALAGSDGGAISKIADISIIVPQPETPRIQEAHILIIHILCELIEDAV